MVRDNTSNSVSVRIARMPAAAAGPAAEPQRQRNSQAPSSFLSGLPFSTIFVAFSHSLARCVVRLCDVATCAVADAHGSRTIVVRVATSRQTITAHYCWPDISTGVAD